MDASPTDKCRIRTYSHIFQYELEQGEQHGRKAGLVQDPTTLAPNNAETMALPDMQSLRHAVADLFGSW